MKPNNSSVRACIAHKSLRIYERCRLPTPKEYIRAYNPGSASDKTRLVQAGWQQESYEDNDFHNLPITPVCRADGTALIVQVEYPGRPVAAQVWRAQVGRIPLYLLDTNIAANQLWASVARRACGQRGLGSRLLNFSRGALAHARTPARAACCLGASLGPPSTVAPRRF